MHSPPVYRLLFANIRPYAKELSAVTRDFDETPFGHTLRLTRLEADENFVHAIRGKYERVRVAPSTRDLSTAETCLGRWLRFLRLSRYLSASCARALSPAERLDERKFDYSWHSGLTTDIRRIHKNQISKSQRKFGDTGIVIASDRSSGSMLECTNVLQ